MQDYRPNGHFGMRSEENSMYRLATLMEIHPELFAVLTDHTACILLEIFSFMRQINISDGTEPITSVLSATLAGEGSQKSSVGISYVLPHQYSLQNKLKQSD
jgi:hypothetical protein